ncbi:MAG: Bacteriocin-protection, YdeI or OmpD-Associated, partial [Chloroflexota bacterium]|nr:Bacteriocin-protection, YdeI or OmpD-Associated [Chloroflexota bacterium]
SHTRKKEFVEWLNGAKLPETRRRRMAQLMVMLRGSGRR